MLNTLWQHSLSNSPTSWKWFGSADCDTICTKYLSLCIQSANQNHLRGTAGISGSRGSSDGW